MLNDDFAQQLRFDLKEILSVVSPGHLNEAELIALRAILGPVRDRVLAASEGPPIGKLRVVR